MIPKFEFKVICMPDFSFPEQFYRIVIQEEDGSRVAGMTQILRIEDLKNNSFMDHIWKVIRAEFDKELSKASKKNWREVE